MRGLARDRTYHYFAFDGPEDANNVKVRGVENDPEGFEFFRGLGIIGYQETFRIWLSRFPRPLFLAALKDREVVSWAFVEEWREAARDGVPVHVLRAIETLPLLRGRRVGLRLLILAAKERPGYMITKPLTKRAEAFFRAAGFRGEDEFARPPVNLDRHAGYLVLAPASRELLLERENSLFLPSPQA
jgi:GNAT superfamily N-acetyltransferase